MVESSGKSKSKNEGWGLGLFFIFFHNHPPLLLDHNINKKRSSLYLSSNSSSNLLVSRAQSTLSICGLLLFTTLLIFTLSPFEPTASVFQQSRTNNSNGNSNNGVSRRILRDTGIWKSGYRVVKGRLPRNAGIPALQGMGELYLKGSKSMSDLIVGHVSEQVSGHQIRSFIRVVVYSGLLSRVDLVLVFASREMAGEFGGLVKSECDSVLRLVQLGGQVGRGELGFGLTRYLRGVGEGGKEPLWGRRVGGSNLTTLVGESTRPSYGSVVGFDSSELDPEDSLSGFLDHVPMSLRRWACYPMLLGRVRRNFKHVMLADVAGSLILSDPFARVRNHSSESVFVWSNPNPVAGTESTRHGRKARIQEQKEQLHPGVIVGGSRGVRRLASAALTEIVRGSIDHKGKNKNSITESGLVNQLVRSKHLMKGISLMTPTESIPDSSSLSGFNSADSRSNFLALSDNFSVVRRGNSNNSNGNSDVDEVVTREICAAHKLFSSVYRDCLARQEH